jgi:hypothetical protein
MVEKDIIDVWNEVTISDGKLVVTLVSETMDGTTIAEDMQVYHMADADALEGIIDNLSLSQQSRHSLMDWNDEREQSEDSEESNTEPVLTREDLKNGDFHTIEDVYEHLYKDEKYYKDNEVEEYDPNQSNDHLQVGDIVRDTRPPTWSENNELKVVGLPDENANEYVVSERADIFSDKTVWNANPQCDEDEDVVECQYLDDTDMSYPNASGSTYAFPVSRLEQVE